MSFNKNSDKVCLVVTTREKDVMDVFCGDLRDYFVKAVYAKQYMTKRMPFSVIYKRLLKANPDAKVFIFGNTNPRFDVEENMSFVLKKAKKPFYSSMFVDLKECEELEDPKEKAEAIHNTIERTKAIIENELVGIINEKKK